MNPFYSLLSVVRATGVVLCLLCAVPLHGQLTPEETAAPIAVTLGDYTPERGLACPADGELHALEGSARRSYERFEAAVHDQINRDRFRVYSGTRPAEAVLELPVVVHVLHQGEAVGEAFNLGYDQIASALDALNADFANASGIDTGIRFAWARRDPDGRPTTGIVRHAVQNRTALNAAEWMTELGWDAQRYINIYVLPSMGDLEWKGRTVGASMDQPPYGIAVSARAFGTLGWVDAWTAENRTLTHQMGHYLGLRHVYAPVEGRPEDCFHTGDGVCDTPPSEQRTQCVSSGDEADHNHMDALPGVCRNHFTPGQKERMRATVLAILPELLEPTTTDPLVSLDGAITEVGIDDLACSSEGKPWVELANLGTTPIDSAVVRVQLNSRDAYPVFWSGKLLPGGRVRIYAPTMAIGYGPFALTASLELPVENGRNAADRESAFVQLEGYVANNELVYSGENLPGNRLEMALAPDAFGDEVHWILSDQAGTEWAHSAPYPIGKAGIPVHQTACVPAGCYRIELTDAGGDGLNGPNTWYELRSAAGDVLTSGQGDYGAGTTASFCVSHVEPERCMDANLNGVCDAEERMGCTDPMGCNYDPQATYLTECALPEFGRDCFGACLGDADDDGICDQLEWVGCQDPRACNYDDKATDPGACDYGDCAGASESLGDQAASREIKLFPNPSYEQPPVWTVEGFEREGMRARLFSPSGVLVWEAVTEREADGRHRLRTNTWIASGAYILELSAADYEYPVAPSVLHVRVR